MEKILDEIYLGDAYELIKKIPSKSIDLIITDPPYQIDGVHGQSGIFKYRKMKYVNDLKENGSLIVKGIDLSILDEFIRIMRNGINIYIWCNKEQIFDYMLYFVKERKCNFEIIIWAKGDPAPFCSTHYLKDKEYCLYFWEKGAHLKPVFSKAKTFYLTNKNIFDKQDYGHPTIKPLEIIKNFILNSSRPGQLIFDPFLGSGTTAAAAKETGRHYLGFEIYEKYYRIAMDRVNGITQAERKRKAQQLKLF